MKRTIAILLTIACCLSLFGCKKQENLAPTQATDGATEETSTAAPTEESIQEENADDVITRATVAATKEQNKRPAATKTSASTKVSATTKKPTKESTKATLRAPVKKPVATSTKGEATQVVPEADHKHTFGDWALQEASSCIVAGKEVRRCTVCGFTEKRDLPLSDHKLNATNMCRNCHKVIFDDDAALVELGVVCDAWYGSGTKACNVWDIKCWNGKVYRAAGDYDTNSGATTMLAYDIANRVWDTSYKAKDEAIHGFVEIGGKLVAPGIDARESWDYGNYYVLGDDGKWQQMRKVPKAIHNFDMIECDGKVFAAVGTEAVGKTVAVSEDGGQTFTYALLYKDGKLYDLSKYSHSRTYEFVQLNGTVYALVAFYTKSGSETWGIFRYEDGKMHYAAEGKTLLEGTEFSRKHFGGDFEFNGTCYLTARRLYAIKDFSDPSSWKTISMPNSGKVSDVILHDGAIYVLSSRQDLKTKIYTVKIYKSTTGEPGSFEEFASYEYAGFPMSFDYDGNHFYVGVGINALDKSKNGMVLRIKPQK